jgi:uncharacterized protein (DUF1015 family)
MACIKPFRAYIYNAEKIKSYSDVVCPPYDVISSDAQESYHNRDAHNLIHLLLARDKQGEDKYLRAQTYFQEWLKEKILIQDASPAIYFYNQQYHVKGEKKTRFGFISLLKLRDADTPVYAHENTRIGPKEDRLRLLKNVKANLSPIFSVFLDKKRIIQRLNQKYIQGKPFIDIVDDDRVAHKIWKLTSPEVISMVEKGMVGENIFIADGHHRYEVACTYREEMKEKLGSAFTGEEDFNYCMSYFTNTDHRGLSILPIHRLLKLDNELDLAAFKASLLEHFDVEEVKDKRRFFFMMEKGGVAEHTIGMYYKDKKFRLIRLKSARVLDKLISDKPKEYRSLDVSILNHLIFKGIMGYDLTALENKTTITFSPDAEEFIRRVGEDDSLIAFFLNPVKIQQIIAVALAGYTMPAKSTYFYPKVLSGLVINKFKEG